MNSTNGSSLSNGLGSYVMSFTAGLVFGGLVAYITAPRSGNETRHEIRSHTTALQETAEQTADEALESMRKAAMDMNIIAEEFRTQSRTALDESKEQWAEAANDIKNTAVEAIEETRATASESIKLMKQAHAETV